MKLLEAALSGSYMGKRLADGRWYLKLEQLDAMRSLAVKGRMTLAEWEAELRAKAKLLEDAGCWLGEALPAESGWKLEPEAQPVIWQAASGLVNLSLRLLLTGPASEEEAAEWLGRARERLLGERELYLKLKTPPAPGKK